MRAPSCIIHPSSTHHHPPTQVLDHVVNDSRSKALSSGTSRPSLGVGMRVRLKVQIPPTHPSTRNGMGAGGGGSSNFGGGGARTGSAELWDQDPNVTGMEMLCMEVAGE